MKCLKPILTSLALLHAMLTAPLLVECISADGQNLIEFLGQDPCHNSLPPFRAAAPADSSPMAASDAGFAADPCVDLVLESADGVQSCSDSPMPPPHMPVHLAQHDYDANRFLIEADNHNPDRDTRIAPSPPPCACLILRI